ncbi:Methyltransferase domain-containing protein [Roseivivax halotolerans]|uniref:Methyltransferase domain-containing protein n=1 Tax=Roseivivax halotolerans TaxID=93684 RepID=A0A1I5YR45_9RHOB|nr:class I SAM-dependent methyltransferase [Roseivivax halotolerans]SFQ46713.1 Methyltransferase domain-containing protein [Roseivivax halotolerans]
MRASPYRYIPLISDAVRIVRREYRAVAYRGDHFHCPVCTKRWAGHARKEPCLYCGSATRHKLLVLWLDRFLARDPGPATEVLFFAPDWGVQKWLAQKVSVHLTTADYSAPGVDRHWDITAIDAPSDSFDLILCSHVMEHVADDAAGFAELYRILRPDGRLVLQVPVDQDATATVEDTSLADPEERKRRFGQFDHVRRYGTDIAQRITYAGFHVEPLTVADLLSAQDMAYFGMWNDIAYICRKDTATGAPGATPR